MSNPGSAESVSEFLDRLAALDVRVWFEGDALRVSAPAGALTAEMREVLRARKEELRTILAPASDARAADTAAREDSVEMPLSYAQQRLWFFQQLEPASSAYNLGTVLVLKGPLDVQALERAVTAIVTRHEILRCTYAEADGVPHMVLHAPAEWHMPVVDLGAMPAEERQRAAEQHWREETERPFDLVRDLPIRTLLLRLAPDEHQLVAMFHHIAVDGASVVLFMRELAAQYGALRGGPGPALPALRVQYPELARRERAWTGSRQYEQTLRYWKDKLAGDVPPLPMPTDAPRPAVQTYRGAAVRSTLPAAVTEPLRALSRKHGAILSTTLLAAFKTVLFRHTGAHDLVIGLPVANRDRPETRDPIGMFVNTVVLRTDVSGNPTFGELLDRVRTTAFGALEHQEMPFARLLDELRPQHDLSRTPLFQVLFNMFTLEVDDQLTAGDIVMTPPPAERVHAALDSQSKFDLTLYVHERRDGIRLSLVYNADLFAHARMETLLRHLERVIAAVAENPDVRIGDVRLEETAAFRPARLAGATVFADIHPSFIDASIPQRFAEAATRYAGRQAVVTPGTSWTYGELHAEVRRIAAVVGAAAAESPSRVALLCDPGATMIAAILGVLEHGSAYVPLDPAFPVDRMSAVLDDAGATLILAEPQYAGVAERIAGKHRPVVLTDGAAPSEARAFTRPPADAVAYVLYTSGSSGKPKGITQSHRNVLHYVRAYTNALQLTIEDRLTLVASYTFDASVVDIFTALLNGCALHPIDLRREGLHGIARVLEGGITVYHSTPTLYRALTPHLGEGSTATVRYVVLGGERVQGTDIAAFNAQFVPGSVLVNLYGATEATIALLGSYAHGDTAPGYSVPVGTPVLDTDVVLFDAAGQRDPVHGEIAVQSRHVALGYWNAPELTARSFSSTGDDSGTRVYRTGDLGFRLPDGRLEVLGRIDFQVKIRGIRIELSEIETVLAAHPHVTQCVVTAERQASADPMLLAFVVLDTPGATTGDELRAHLALSVPEYMVPAAVVIMDALPLTRTGKIDRRALPGGPALAIAAPQTYVGPRNGVEELLCDIWGEVLGVERVGVHDNFFALGGHSLNATQVLARLRAIAGVELPLRAVFSAPTLEAMASLVQQASSGQGDELPPLRAGARTTDLAPLSFSQERMWFLQQILPEGTAYNMSAAAMIVGEWDMWALTRSLEDLVQRHETLRTTFSTPDGEPRQRIAQSMPAPLIHKDYATLPPEERLPAFHKFASEMILRPFDLEHGPLWWFILARLAPGRFGVVIGMHHIIGDLWSFGVFGRDLMALYAANVKRNTPALPPLEVQYADFAVWQRDTMSGARLDAHLAFWTKRLAGITPLDLPTDRPRPPVMTVNGSRASMTMPRDTAARLHALCAREGVTPFMVLFAAFNALLYRYTGQHDIALGVPIANRTQVGVENLIGTFVNTLVHRNDMSGRPSFRELLRRVRAVALDAYAHQDMPFERLVRELAPERDPSRPPVFQVLFNMANAPVAAVETPGITMQALEIERRAAQFDLAVSTRVDDEVVLFAGYNTDLFDDATIQRLLANYGVIIEAGIAAPDTPIDVLAVMPAAERTAVLEGHNETAIVVPDTTIVALIEDRARAHPDEVAIEFGDSAMTYRDLDARASRLAARLRKEGVARGSLVGVCMQRSPEMVVALLGVLKAGGAYIPIDPAYPSQRVQFMLEDSGARVVVTESSASRAVPSSATAVVVDRERDAIAQEPETRGDDAPAGGDTAYVIYTSGSTGTPKGVRIAHASLVNFLHSMRSAPGLTAKETLLAVTTISFDIAGLELWLPLTSGGTVVLAARETAADGRLLLQLLTKRQPNVMQATPATWRSLLDAGWKPGDTPQLRALCGGEALPRDLADEMLARTREVWNLYGPTETTIWSTAQQVERGGVITIGRPIANTRAYVLDAAQQPVPFGIPGELYIGGAGVAQGYLHRPELTAERFVPDPFAGGAARMYRTGDRARIHPGGVLEHLGRLDDQIKLRGFRIELGEVEAALAQAPEVAQCVAAVKQDRLVAYIVFNPGAELTATEVRMFLRETLPDYMVPSLVVPMQSLPQTPNGKIDRKALPEPLRDTGRGAGAFKAPATATERVIADVWKRLLGIERVSTSDNFFELGGHSLLSMRAVHEIHQETGWRPDARLLFFQSLAQIAAARPAESGH